MTAAEGNLAVTGSSAAW